MLPNRLVMNAANRNGKNAFPLSRCSICRARSRLRMNRPPLTSSVNDSATWTTTSALRPAARPGCAVASTALETCPEIGSTRRQRGCESGGDAGANRHDQHRREYADNEVEVGIE